LDWFGLDFVFFTFGPEPNRTDDERVGLDGLIGSFNKIIVNMRYKIKCENDINFLKKTQKKGKFVVT
jgi:hypothetical protein